MLHPTDYALLIAYKVGDYDHEPYQHQDDANNGPGLDPSRHSGQRIHHTEHIGHDTKNNESDGKGHYPVHARHGLTLPGKCLILSRGIRHSVGPAEQFTMAQSREKRGEEKFPLRELVVLTLQDDILQDRIVPRPDATL